MDKYIGESIDDVSDFIKVAQRIVIPLGKVMDETTSYSNEEGCHRKSVPIQLLTVISMLVNYSFYIVSAKVVRLAPKPGKIMYQWVY